ncbi:GTPase Era [Helcococcus kunzii]|uniref:GTPase Era n=1 Tax=Helcococcus kunzii ATCC 51366 TaxID=883114 RepID=H3NPY0_9FIRM|nr:GTPase Era [Helcococcus kunzii]EHR33202.1 GTP-binding protein Era [Helcococcus kunzii ATCC 51366]MCT1795857.1 GTPase Era [Helcococcus kunzii]MCT1988591.1 GTPase Era [Helcococcus kunzii]QUY65144.1 GTPase Era [Helcococcus kunzii]QZO75805.1 GTPase Era [Helcococcus kunzii]
MFKSGFITVIGRPNVGKSTLLNGLIGEKISIISDKPQTTRNKIQMVLTTDNMQCVFLDTPGIQMPKNKLGDYMLSVSKSTLNEVDIVTFIVDLSEDIGKLDQYILDILDGVDTKTILLVNKIDIAESQDQIDNIINKYKEMDKFDRIVPISALEKTNYDKYLEVLYELLEEGPMYYPADMITDQPERNIIAEIVREKVLRNMFDEIPHGIAVEVMKISENENEKMQIEVNLYVEQNSHKGMVIGKGGSMLKKIGIEARRDIENLLDAKVNLKIWVKVAKDWRKKDSRVKDFGYR